MKAVIYTTYGPPEVLQIRDVDKPTPKPNEVLVKVHMATLNRTDTGFRRANYVVSRLVTGLFKPKRIISGSEFAGEVVEVGSDVKNYSVGDRVFGFEDVRAGAHAEFMTVNEHGPMATIPNGLSYEEAAAAGEGASYALNDIWAANVTAGQQVLVYGASGAIGSAAVQIAHHLGATVTAVCGKRNVDLIKLLGAKTVYNYQDDDFTQISQQFDFIFDAVGKTSYGVCKTLLTPNGKYCSTELGKFGQNPLLAIWFALIGSRRVIFPIPKINQHTISQIQKLLEADAYRPVIDRTYTMDDIVEATRYVESGRKTGNVLIKIHQPSER